MFSSRIRRIAVNHLALLHGTPASSGYFSRSPSHGVRSPAMGTYSTDGRGQAGGGGAVPPAGAGDRIQAPPSASRSAAVTWLRCSGVEMRMRS